jgi:hypothetical protein
VFGEITPTVREVLAEFLQCEVSRHGEVTRLRGPKPTAFEWLDAALLCDIVRPHREGFPTAAQMLKNLPGCDIRESDFAERVEALRHWLSPVRVQKVIRRVLEIDPPLNVKGRRHGR